MTIEALRNHLEQMRAFKHGAEYYAVTLSATEQGKIIWQVRSTSRGITDTVPPREIRAPVVVDPSEVVSAWAGMRHPYVIVHTNIDLFLFHLLGGHALVEKSVALSRRPEWTQPWEVAQLGFAEYHLLSTLPQAARNRTPNKTLRMRVLKRDRRRCRICGRRPEDYGDITLHVHHILPWATGGVTHDPNLITLCSTCHDGLDPHYDPELFDYNNVGLNKILNDISDPTGFYEGVRRYRRLAFELWKKTRLEHTDNPVGQGLQPSPTKTKSTRKSQVQPTTRESSRRPKMR